MPNKRNRLSRLLDALHDALVAYGERATARALGVPGREELLAPGRRRGPRLR